MSQSSAAAKVSGSYNKETTSEEVMKDLGSNVQGKHIVVTGANCGLGLKTVQMLAQYDASVVLACRSAKNGEEAIRQIISENPDAKVKFMQLDLGSLQSVRDFARQYKESGDPLHILVNNAGVMACPLTYTSDGLEMQMGVNHMGHFLLTLELLDILKSSGTATSPARVINLSSLAHYAFAPSVGIRLDDLKGTKYYQPWERYGASKLANVLFSKELNQRCKDKGYPIISVSLHPGTIRETNLGRHGRSTLSLIGGLRSWSFIFSSSMSEEAKAVNTTQGTATTLLCCATPDLVPGGYYAKCNEEKVFVHPMVNNEALAKSLWEVSLKETNAPAVL